MPSSHQTASYPVNESKDLIIKLHLIELKKVKQVYLTKLRIAYPPKRILQLLIVADFPHLCLHEDISVVIEQSASPGQRRNADHHPIRSTPGCRAICCHSN